METIVIEEFTHYKVLLYGQGARDGADYGIMMKIPSGIVHLRFIKGDLPANRIEDKRNKVFYVYHRSDQYAAFIDIFRNEEPLFFYYNMTSNLSYITSTDEPVGEEETGHFHT
jgi:hypothetical protein